MKSLPTLAAAVTFVTGQALANPIDVIRPDAPELAPYGPLPIGVQTLSFVNPGQIDIVNTTEEATPTYDRPFMVEVWYPAAEGTEPGGGRCEAHTEASRHDSTNRWRAETTSAWW